MGDDIILFVVFGFLYISDSFFLLHKQSVAFRGSVRGRFQVILPSSNAGNRDYAVHMFSLLPPLPFLYVCNLLPVSLSEKGMLSYISQTLSESGRPRQSGRVIEYDQIKNVTVDDVNLLINAENFANFRVSENARIISDTVEDIIRVNENSASKALDNLIHGIFDINQISKTLDEYEKASKTLRILCNSIFVVFFILFPILARWQGLGTSLIAVLILLGVLLPPLCITFFSLHKRYSIGNKWDRIGCIIRFIICPPSSIRANDQISRFLISKYHPVVGALALCGSVDTVKLLRKVLRDLKNPIHQDINTPISLSIDEEWRKKMISSVELVAQQSGIENEELVDSPEKSDSSILAYCPRCLTQFSVPIDSCPDCLGVNTLLFPSSEDKNG